MSSFLINALLSSSPNYEIVFDALCWPSDSLPDNDRIEALATFIEGIGKTLDAGNDTCLTVAKREYCIQKVESIIWTQCFPLLSNISANILQNTPTKEALSALCRLLSVCLLMIDNGATRKVALSVLPTLQLSKDRTEEECNRQGPLHLDVAIEVMAVLIPALASDEHLALITLSSALACIKTLSDSMVSKITVRIIFTLLNCYRDTKLSATLRFILADMYKWHMSSSSPVVTDRTLLCLTALSDYLFPQHSQSLTCSGRPDPRLSIQFWRILQNGLIHSNNVSRKRSLYLLKRSVALSEVDGLDLASGAPLEEDPEAVADENILFRWALERSKLLREFWEDYALVMETLEENQIHVVRPVLNRIDILIQTTANYHQVSGTGLFHPSWLLCVYQRMFHSENKSVMREGVYHLLELKALRHPAFALAFSQFIVGPFIDVLSENSLFHRVVGQRIGECPELGVKLQAFMVTFFNSLPQENKGLVLLQLIQRLGSQHWCAVPILFLSQALSHLPHSPLLGRDGLQALRDVLRCTMITHQVLLRGAAQCFFLNTALCLTDVRSLTLDDVFSFLTYFRADESLCRGTQLWNRLCGWLKDNEGNFKPSVGEGSAVHKTVKDYVLHQIHTFLKVPPSTGQVESVPEPREADVLARAVFLCVDTEELRTPPGEETGARLESLLHPLLDSLSRISTNVYLPLRKTDKSLQLLLLLFQLSRRPPRCLGKKQEDTATAALEKLVLAVVDPIQDFILRRLCGELTELCDMGRAELYLSLLRELVGMKYVSPQHWCKIQHSYFPKLIKDMLKILQEPTEQVPTVATQVTRAVAMATLAMVCDVAKQQEIDSQSETMSALVSLNCYFYNDNSATPSFNQTLSKPVTADSTGGLLEQAPLLQDWGRVAAHYIRDQWTCLSFLKRSVERSTCPELLQAAVGCSVEALGLLPSDLVLPVLDFMEASLPQVALYNEALCVEVVTLSWELVRALSSNPHDFWPSLKAFVSMAFHHSLLELTHTQSPRLTATLKQIAGELLDLSQAKTGVFNVLIQHCCHTWLPSGPGGGARGGDAAFSSALLYLDVLTEACVYGPVFRRDQKLIQEVQTYVEQLGDQCSANAVVPGDDRDEQFPRVCALAFLSRLDPTNLLHQGLMEELVVRLLKKDEEISKSKVRYYSNSLQHRVKNRIWQTLLLLLPKLKEGFVGTVLNSVFEAGFCSNQASVKYLIEWLMVLILVQHPGHMDSLWACFSVDQEKTKTSVCTFLSVLVHLNIIMPKLKEKALQWRKALDVILQWCFSHNFSVRLYALLALKRVWSLTEVRAEAEEGAGGPDTLGGLATVVKACLHQAEAMQSTGNANKNWTRIQEHFFFGAFHPVRDYSVETIFHSFPSLSEVADDEWIPSWKFDTLVCFSEAPSLPLRNPVPDLSQLQPGDWVQQDKGEQEREERWAEVQKKITPWRLGIQEQEPEVQPVPQQRAARLGKLHGALLVVASLIDKPTNLGGLCRTCEIFGASSLVLDSLRHVSDKHFQALSVSSELWLPLLEVKPMELADFLQLKKGEGYCIVGVEQTANSQSLQDYQFPEKTLLLLGNEREGIPANLLQLLDVCVEIPQQGVIRSLNVHVSAALLVWEYTRQHLHRAAGPVNPETGPTV
ncbi:putative methyltransferase TARBP1 [Aplochiton taeniatus]